MPLSQALTFSSRHAGSQSSTRTPSRDQPDSRLPLLRTPKSHPTERPQPASSLGFRSLFNSLGSLSSRQSKISTVTRLKTPTPPTPTTPSFPVSSRDNPRSASPLKRASDLKSPFQLHHPPAASQHSSVGHEAESRRIPRPVPEQRDPKWKDVEAEWRRQARHLKPSHKACLLGAVCINIRDPLDDMTGELDSTLQLPLRVRANLISGQLPLLRQKSHPPDSRRRPSDSSTGSYTASYIPIETCGVAYYAHTIKAPSPELFEVETDAGPTSALQASMSNSGLIPNHRLPS